MTEAALNDSPGETGWTVEAHLLASTSDWTQVGAISSGNWKNKPPEFKPVGRPFEAIKKKKSAADRQKQSVAEMHRMLQEKRLAQGG